MTNALNVVRAADVRDRIAQLERENATLKSALTQVQWGNETFDPLSGENGTVYNLCPLCDQSEVRGHSPDCLVGAALNPEANRHA